MKHFGIQTQKLREIIPELIVINKIVPPDYVGSITFELTSHRQELIQVASWMSASFTPELKKMLLEVGCYFERQIMKSGTVQLQIVGLL
ncbi:hypothetical protein [Nostoc sp. UHCC 0252]|uniref:hypothetical protein n=1 Tax=Nostoc sp. UHCC 0252 TaxID=3110241 RepID=UPI002B1F0154|nr:hypothetical protein [Nostoc sp. UHCC 0252]MEA5604608.1 hypothetical protein [Nostoc sp. UHCC 0252]